MSDATVKVGFVSNAVTTGLARLRSQFTSFRNDVNSEFSVGQFLAVGSILAGLHSILDAAGKFADLSARFGVGAEGLQRIGNAAAQDGVELEGVAAAMNKVVIAQGKAREGNKEVSEALADLNINAAEFINMNPEQAFYAVADGVAQSDDSTKAYTATVALLGRGAGALIPTLQRGSEEIKNIGNAAGVMSAETVAMLDDVGDKWGAMFNQIKVWGAEAFGWIAKAAQSLGAGMAATAARVEAFFGMISDSERDAIIAAAEAGFEEIWRDKSKDVRDEKPRKKFDVEETEESLKKTEELEKLNDKIAEQKRRMMLEALDSQSRINELVREEGELREKAAKEADPIKQAELNIKANDIQKDLLAEREKVAKEEEQRQDRIQRKREAYEKKSADEELAGKTDKEKLAILNERKKKLDEVLKAEQDVEKVYDLLGERADLNKDIANLSKPKEAKEEKFEVIASSLARVGGGGGAFLASKTDAAERTARATEKAAQKAEIVIKELQEIRDRVGESRWNP